MQGLLKKYLLAVYIVLPLATGGWGVEFGVMDSARSQEIEDPYLLTPPSSAYPDPSALLDAEYGGNDEAALRVAARDVGAEFEVQSTPGDAGELQAPAVDSTAPDGWSADEWSDEAWTSDPYPPAAGCLPTPCTTCCRATCGGDCCRRRGSEGLLLDFWIAQGFSGNTHGPRNNSNLPVTFNDRANEYQMNQLYVVLGRRVHDEVPRWDIGGQVDLLWGTDYFFTMANGLETRQDGSPKWNSGNGPRTTAAGTGAAMYGLAMPQLFAEVFAPVGRGVRVKAGHFYTTLGYESVMAPMNFFYSHAYSYQYGQPFTHTGVLTEFGLSRDLYGHFAYTRGWNNWEDLNGKPAYLTGLTWRPTNMASLAFALLTGSEDPLGQNDRTVYTLVYARQVGCKSKYVLEHVFGTESNAAIGRDFAPDSAKWYGVTQYFYHDVSEKLSLGARVEWFRDQDNARVLGIPLAPSVGGGNYYESTFGLNWRPTPQCTIRPEIRYDWSDTAAPVLGVDGMYDDFTRDNQLTLSFDVIFRY